MKEKFKLAIEKNMHSESYAKRFQKYLNKLKSVHEENDKETDDEKYPKRGRKRTTNE